MPRSPHSGAPAVRFQTRPLSDLEASALLDELCTIVPAHRVWMGGDTGLPYLGAIRLGDAAEAGSTALIDRLRRDPRIEPHTVVAGQFP